MKKLFALLAVAIGVVACQKDQADFGVNLGGEQEAFITVNLPEVSRAGSEFGAFENGVLNTHDLRYILEIYYGEKCYRQVQYTNEKSASFPVRLAPGREYKFAVWADFVTKNNRAEDTDLFYETSNGLDEISILNGVPMTEARDAFYGNYTLAADAHVANMGAITLTRPFAKVRVVTTDVQDLNNLGVALPTNATVTYKTTINNKFNALPLEEGETRASSDANAVKTYTFNYANTYAVENGEMTLFADYLFVNANATTQFDLTVTNHVAKSFNTDIPVVANQVTTIKGDILTNGSDIKVEINDNLAAETIYLEGNVTLTEDLVVNKSIFVRKGATAVLNLNGHNIKVNNNSEELEKGDGIIVYGDLTIEGNGTVEANTRAVWARKEAGAKVTINGGHFIGSKYGSEVIYASGKGQIVINGGTFEAVTEDQVSFAAPQYAVLNLHGNGKDGCNIVVKGGSFKNFDPANNVSENPKHNFCAEGYVSVANGEWFDVMKGVAVANINDFNTALSNAENAAINVTNDVNFGIANSISVERDVILNFNDNDVVAGGETTKNASIDIFGDYTVTVNDANITGGSIMAYYGADVVLNNVELTYNWYQSGRNMIYAASDNDKQVVTVINGGYYDMTGGSGNRYICAHGNAIVYVNGGTFTGKGPGATHAPFDAINIGSYTARIIISGGTFDFDPSKDYIGSGNTAYPPTATIADGYKVVNNGNGTWSVVKQ